MLEKCLDIFTFNLDFEIQLTSNDALNRGPQTVAPRICVRRLFGLVLDSRETFFSKVHEIINLIKFLRRFFALSITIYLRSTHVNSRGRSLETPALEVPKEKINLFGKIFQRNSFNIDRIKKGKWWNVKKWTTTKEKLKRKWIYSQKNNQSHSISWIAN